MPNILINRDVFFTGYRENFGKIQQLQVDGLNFLLTKLENSKIIEHPNSTIELAMWAYVLMTIKWETGVKQKGIVLTYTPITEIGSMTYLRSKRYWPYIGRGYVQLTWDWNYKQFGRRIGVDLIANPELANEPEIAWKILEEGMTDLTPQDPEFTGKSLEDYFNDKTINFRDARKIINPKDWDSYEPIKSGAMKFWSILKAAQISPAEAIDGVDVITEGVPEGYPK